MTLIRIAVVVTAAALSDSAGVGATAQISPEKTAGIAACVDAWVAMWNSYDLSQVDSLFLCDDRATYFSSEKEGVIRGFQAVREHHRGFGFVEGGKRQDNRLWVDSLNIASFGPAAVVTGVWYFQRPAGAVQRGPVTFVYVLQGKEYRLAHMHFANYPRPAK